MYYPDVPALAPEDIELLCNEYIAHNKHLDPHIADRLGVKRGLRNPDGTGVLAGLTNVCDVVGYKKDQEGHIIPIPGKLIYRGVNINEIVDEAYAGDIIGVFDPGIFSIGDTITVPGKKFRYSGIPTFEPEHFMRVSPKDTMKRKQFLKGTEQIAQEGAIQIFKVPNSGMEEVIVGVVGTLQFDVFQYRMKAEYGVDLRMQQLPYEQLRFITKAPVTDLKDLYLSTDAELLEDYRGRSLLVFASQWSINFILKRNPGLELSETAQ